MKIAILTQPADLICERLCRELDEKEIDYTLYWVPNDVSASVAATLMPQINGTPAVYVDGQYIADPFFYFNNDFKEREIPNEGDWDNYRTSDKFVVVTMDNCRGCKTAKDLLDEKSINYKEMNMNDKDTPSSKFLYHFFSYESNESIDYPMVIVNGHLVPHYQEVIENGVVKI